MIARHSRNSVLAFSGTVLANTLFYGDVLPLFVGRKRQATVRHNKNVANRYRSPLSDRG